MSLFRHHVLPPIDDTEEREAARAETEARAATVERIAEETAPLTEKILEYVEKNHFAERVHKAYARRS